MNIRKEENSYFLNNKFDFYDFLNQQDLIFASGITNNYNIDFMI
jgi:hypothetical protein